MFVYVIVVVHVRGPILGCEKGYQHGHDYDDVDERAARLEQPRGAAPSAL